MDNLHIKIRRYATRAKDYLLFPSWNDKKLFYRLSHGKFGGNEVPAIHIRTAGKAPVFIRNNRIDPGVLNYVFFKKYHLPPKQLRPGAVIVDLGTNIGLTVRHLKYLYPDSTIIGVEMDYGNYVLAKKNLDGLENCFLVNAAIWYKDGLVNYAGADAQSYYCTENETNIKEKVRSCALSTLFEEHNLHTVDFVKMDIEGAESFIFDYDCSWLKAVQSINIEVHNQESLTKYISVLEDHGFTCMVSKNHWSAVLGYR